MPTGPTPQERDPEEVARLAIDFLLRREFKGLPMIAAVALGADATISFTSIPATYRHLVIVGSLRSDRAAVSDTLGMQFNGDTGANYDGELLQASAAATAASETLAATSLKIGVIAGDTATAGLFSPFLILIPNYTDTTILPSQSSIGFASAGTTTTLQVVYASGNKYRIAGAITQIKLLPTGGGTNFKSAGKAELYGLG